MLLADYRTTKPARVAPRLAPSSTRFPDSAERCAAPIFKRALQVHLLHRSVFTDHAERKRRADCVQKSRRVGNNLIEGMKGHGQPFIGRGLDRIRQLKAADAAFCDALSA